MSWLGRRVNGWFKIPVTGIIAVDSKRGGDKEQLSDITSGSISIKRLDEVLGLPKLKFGGVRVKINDLEGREIIFKGFFELADTEYGSNSYYLRVEADVWEDGFLKPVTFNTSSKDIMQKLRKAKDLGVLPVKATLRRVKNRAGSGYYWILE